MPGPSPLGSGSALRSGSAPAARVLERNAHGDAQRDAQQRDGRERHGPTARGSGTRAPAPRPPAPGTPSSRRSPRVRGAGICRASSTPRCSRRDDGTDGDDAQDLGLHLAGRSVAPAESLEPPRQEPQGGRRDGRGLETEQEDGRSRCESMHGGSAHGGPSLLGRRSGLIACLPTGLGSVQRRQRLLPLLGSSAPQRRCAAPAGVAPRVSSSSCALTASPWRSYVRWCWSSTVRSASAAAS